MERFVSLQRKHKKEIRQGRKAEEQIKELQNLLSRETQEKEAEKKRLGIDVRKFAFRVGYLVTWGHNAASGKSAAAAGIRKGDVILSIDGKDDFESLNHFHAWFRLTREVGRHVVVEALRGGKRRRISLPVLR